MTPPIRFLTAALGGWACLRSLVLVPWAVELPPAAPRAVPPHLPPSAAQPLQASAEQAGDAAVRSPHPRSTTRGMTRPSLPKRWRDAAGFARRQAPPPAYPLQIHALGWTLQAPRAAPAGFAGERHPRMFLAPAPMAPSRFRWTASAWVHSRGGDAPALAPGGLLGGSQAGAGIAYQISPAVLLTARASAPLRRTAGAEAAVGVEWKPLPAVPLRLLAERREAVGRDGRSAFSVTLHGGVGDVPLPGGFRLDAYGQAGAVGARSRELFAELSGRAARPVGAGVSVGAGAWAAAQPGAARFDIGPSATLRLPKLHASLSADWRFRVAGGASPGSGPALTLWKDF